MKRSLLMFVFILFITGPRLSVAQDKPFITLDRSNSIGLGSFSVQATTDLNFRGWYSNAQRYEALSFLVGFSKRVELSMSWYFANSTNSYYARPSGISWINNYLKVNILDEENNPFGLSAAFNIPFHFYSSIFIGPYPAIFIRLIGDKHFNRHYTALNIDMHLSESLYWVSRFGYTYSLKNKNPMLNLGLEGYVFYDVLIPKQYFLIGGGPVFNFEYTKENFLYFFTLSLTPEFHRYYIIFYNNFSNAWEEFEVKYPGGAIRITTGIKFM
ncbi:MAG: hypothetical protein GXO48_03715 [Chlorobi bacterium]|nr:hypothetical protein [Chlorobiota bacterium]